ncbi:MAG: hypothetical protein WC862_01490 [Patescibacteria group bacterium]
MKKIEELYKSIVDFSKNKYTGQAIQNSDGIKKGKQFFAARFGYIFAELNGHDSSEFDMNACFREE